MAYDFKNIIVGAAAIVIVSASCLPDPLEVNDIPQLEQKIVVSSQLIPGHAVAVLLTKSIGALDASNDSDPEQLLDQIIIEDATVRVDANGQQYPLRYLGKGVYGRTQMPTVIGEEYTLVVHSPTAGHVKATTTINERVTFRKVDAYLTIDGRDSLAQISYVLQDKPGPNWYMITAQHISIEGREEDFINPGVTTKLLTDGDFRDYYRSDNFKILFDEVKKGDTISVTVANIDKDYYDFMKLREDTRFGIAAAIGEPINYPSNVEGGLGFFNLFVPDVRLITLGE